VCRIGAKIRSFEDVQETASVKMTPYLLKSTVVGALGGLLFGFDTAVIAGTTEQLTVIFNLTSFTLGLTVLSDWLARSSAQ
jgi:hypothetical protein